MPPPFNPRRFTLNWWAFMVEQYDDRDALRMLWWSSAIGPGGVYEQRPTHSKCQK